MLFDEHEHGFSQKRTYQTVQKIKNYFMLSQYQNLGSISLLGGQFYGFGIKQASVPSGHDATIYRYLVNKSK